MTIMALTTNVACLFSADLTWVPMPAAQMMPRHVEVKLVASLTPRVAEVVAVTRGTHVATADAVK